jgi:hypothetical protein
VVVLYLDRRLTLHMKVSRVLSSLRPSSSLVHHLLSVRSWQASQCVFQGIHPLCCEYYQSLHKSRRVAVRLTSSHGWICVIDTSSLSVCGISTPSSAQERGNNQAHQTARVVTQEIDKSVLSCSLTLAHSAHSASFVSRALLSD